LTFDLWKPFLGSTPEHLCGSGLRPGYRTLCPTAFTPHQPSVGCSGWLIRADATNFLGRTNSLSSMRGPNNRLDLFSKQPTGAIRAEESHPTTLYLYCFFFELTCRSLLQALYSTLPYSSQEPIHPTLLLTTASPRRRLLVFCSIIIPSAP
jgi:hypothetical protein